MSKLGFLTNMKDYCVCEHLNLGKKPKVKNGLKPDRKLNHKKTNRRQKYEFPVKKFQQLERFFLNSPRRHIKPTRNKDRSKENHKPKKMQKPPQEQRSQDWCGNQQYRDHQGHNRVRGEFNDTEIVNCEENRLQVDPAE